MIELVDAWRGVRSLGGLAITIAVILIYLLPELLSLTTASAVLFMVLFLVNEFSWKSALAMTVKHTRES